MTADQLISEMRERFCSQLRIKRHAASTKNRTFIDDQRYQQLLEEIKNAKTAEKKSPRDYWLLKHYDFITVGQKHKLIFPVNTPNTNIIYYVTDSELFQVLHDAHQSIGHGGRDRMLKELSTRYKNITRHDVELYLQLCEPCQQKQRGIKKGIVVKPILSSEFNSRCQVDLIDYQSHPDREYKFVMVYQDHLTKFVILRALKTKRAEEVAYNLLDIFTLIGAPAILQSDNGREFSNQIVSSLKTYWPTLKIVHGKPRHSQSQGSVERANQDIENMLTTWMQDSDSERWSDGLRFVQLMKNRAFHSGIKRTPYEALFGSKIKVGISLPLVDTYNLESEEDLENVINSSPSIPIASESSGPVIVDPAGAQNQPLQAQHQQSPAIESAEIHNEALNVQSAHDEHMTIPSNEISDKPANVEDVPSEVNDQPLNDLSFRELSTPLVCCVCSEETTGAHSCRMCNRPIHAICAAPEKNMAEGCGSKVVCPLCAKNALAVENRISSKDNLTEQAQKMLKTSEKKFPPVALGTTVRIPVPEVDRGRGDARNILAVVLQKTDDELYQLGTKQGVVKTLYSRQQFTVCHQELLKKEDVPNLETTLRTVATQQSTGTGQGFVKCSCKKHCDTKKCSCLKSKILCTSKCHNSSSCKNK
ncbi:hypothetical protein PYW08_006300 [Mythimna loreyi]|uniref:Uncharacterized protein n=1 Tax=Mythimna loreyi TaxID=667449 RepID=A0ACC2QMA5_9NEOP|nr:hypothetical protein PYW08_006300 [Mythimna loreyi]